VKEQLYGYYPIDEEICNISDSSSADYNSDFATGHEDQANPNGQQI
jgi:hypothetical protein